MKTFTLACAIAFLSSLGLFAQQGLNIKSGGAVTVNGNLNIIPAALTCGQVLTDTRDGKTYSTVLIGTQCWMAQNLNVGTTVLGIANQTNNSVIEKYCYNDDDANCAIYGGLYQWDEAMQYTTTEGVKGICPTGWHLPNDGEWTALINSLGGESIAGEKMKETGTTHWRSPNSGATNSSGFTALGGGYRHYNSMFLSLTVNANFWSSTQNDATQAWSRYLSCDYDNIRQQKNPKQYSYSIRCVQDCNSAPSSPSEGIHVSNSTTQIIWNWNAIPGAIGYKWNTINDYSSATDMGSATTKTETGLTSNTYYTRFVWAYNPCGISLGTTLIWHTALFDIGQSYGGGIIFYIDGTGQHGLISATNDQGSGAVWGCYGTLIGGTSTAIGTGQANTSSIVSRCIEGNAARTCNDLVLNGYDDWFLPSKDELNQMFLQKGIIGGFVPGYYWSSSEYNTNLAWYQSFYNGNQEWGVKNSATGFVRAVRSF